MKILMVLFKTHGDIVMGSTIVRAVKAKYPDSTIDFMTEKPYVNTLEGNPDLNEIIVGSTYMDANMVFIKGKYDKIFRLNMANQLETAWHHLPEYQNQHLMEWYAKRAGLESLTDYHHYIYLTDKDIAAVNRFWSNINMTPGKTVAMHTSSGAHAGPQSRVESKDWPIQYFNALADDLIANGFNVMQIGAFSDKKLSNPKVIDATGKLTFKQNFELFKKCDAYVGNDSGPAYLAAEAGIPCLLIMGSTQNKGLGAGPSVGPCHPNVRYIEPVRPNNSMCTPVPCYTHCQIGKAGGCVVDVTPKDVKRIVWEMLGDSLPTGGDKVFKADDVVKLKENALDVHTTMSLEDFGLGPKLVVGMLTYNEEKYIKYSLGAVYDYVDYIIVIDSFSTDNTIKYIQELDKDGKITIIQRAWNNNYAEARNTYLEFIRENIYPTNPNLYYFRIDADEVYYSSKMSGLKKIVAENPGANSFRFNFYTFEGTHEHLSENNPIETRACVFKYSPKMLYVSALHEMPVIPEEDGRLRLLYTHDLGNDNVLGVKRIDEFFYCHFAWCDVDRCLTKARNYTEHYVAQGTETKERLDSISNDKDSWWWRGHASDNKFEGEYPEIFEKLGELESFKNGTALPQKIAGGKFSIQNGELMFETDEAIETVLENKESMAIKLTSGAFALRDGKLMFDSEEPVQEAVKVEEKQPAEPQKPKLSAFTIVKSAIKFDYPIIESINSVLPFVDEFVINVGAPDEDGTKALLEQHFGSNPKVKMFDSVWEGRDQGIKFLTSQTNIAKDACSNEWGLYVQADELYLEEAFPKIRQAIEACVAYPHILGFAFNFLHFDGDYASVNPKSYPREIRLVRRNAVSSIHDAVTFGVKAFSNTPLTQMDKMFAPLDVTVLHYGWTREPEKMKQKLISFDSFYHTDEELKEMHKDFDTKHRDGYDYGKREGHLHYVGQHPSSAHDRIRKFEKEHADICKNFVFAAEAKPKRRYVVERVINGQNLSWENDLITDEFIYLGDHISVPGIGDSILHTGVIREVNKKFPDKKIILRTMAEMDAFENNPRIFKVERELLPHPIDIPTGHYMEQKCRYFGIDNPEIRGEIFISDKEKAIAEETLQILSGNKPTIMFCFNSTNPKKNWIAENWIKIVEVLKAKYDVYQIDQSIHYSRAKDRPEEFGRPVIYPTIPNARQELRNAAGGMRKMMALMSVAKKYLGVNTSFMNIASCFGDDNIVFQHDVDADGTKLRALMAKASNPSQGFMDMNRENLYNRFKELRPEWCYPGTKYFDATYDIDRAVEGIKNLWM